MLLATTTVALARGFLHSWMPLKLAMLSVVLLSVGVVAGGMAPRSPPSEPRPAVDAHGDPLPEGAIARMGSIQLRHAAQSDFVILPDSKTILTAGGRVVRFWDMVAGKQVREVKLQGSFSPGRSATLSPNGKILAGLDHNKLIFWEIGSGKQIKMLPGPKGNWNHLYFSPDSKTLLIGTWKPEVILWDWAKGSQRQIVLPTRKIGMDSTFHSCISPNGKYLAGGGGYGETLCVYELATGREMHRLRCDASTSTFSADNKRLIVSTMSGRCPPSLCRHLATVRNAAIRRDFLAPAFETGRRRRQERGSPPHRSTR